MYYANHAAFDKKAQKILKTAMRYKVIKNEDEVNSILCSNLSADTNNCALCTNEAVILGRRKLGTLYFADVYLLVYYERYLSKRRVVSGSRWRSNS